MTQQRSPETCAGRSKQPLSRLAIPLFVLLLFVLSCLAGVYWFVLKPWFAEMAFQQLLDGSESAQIAEIIIRDGQPEPVSFDDPELVRYLSDAFRAAKRTRGDVGHSRGSYFEFVFRMSTGGMVRCALWILDPRENVLRISYPYQDVWFQDPVEYTIELPEPIPPSVEAIRRLLAGEVLQQ